MPAPSLHPIPSADAAKALHPPSAARPRCLENSLKAVGKTMTATPPASAIVHSPVRSDWHARCSATSEDEHAVSSVTAGPSRPSTYDTRPEITAVAPPVSRYPSAPAL